MRGLFLRIYAALAAVLVVGLLLAGTLRAPTDSSQWDGAVAAAAGFPSAAASVLGRAAPTEQDAALTTLSERFGAPVRLLPREAIVATLDEVNRAGLSRGESVTVLSDLGPSVHVPLAGQPFVATLGPISRPDTTPPVAAFVLLAALGVLAIVVSVWLRPLQTELQRLVRVADDLGAGRLDARAELPEAATLGPVGGAFDAMATRVQASIREREALIQDREALLHAVSHELRSPLQRMRFGLALLDGETDATSFPDRLEELGGDIDQLDQLVGELLDWARASSSRVEQAPVDLDALVTRLAADARRLRPSLAVEVIGSAGTWTGRAPDLERALSNFVTNAARWATSRIELRLTTEAVAVHDDGPGVPVADRTRVFEPFVRLDPARSRDAGGTGLGLALAARIAEQHNASLTVSDSPLGGACFTWHQAAS